MSVIRVYDVPEDFVCMRVAVNINTGNSTGPVKYYADASLINKVDVIEDYEDFNEYYVNKLNRYIADYEVQKQETQKNIDDNNSSIDNLESLINNLEMQKKYTTADELNKLNTQIADVNKQLILLNNDNKELQEEIDEINKKIDDYILYVGARGGYKNFENLIRAYSINSHIKNKIKMYLIVK
mgnify:CR=1 FL=1